MKRPFFVLLLLFSLTALSQEEHPNDQLPLPLYQNPRMSGNPLTDFYLVGARLAYTHSYRNHNAIFVGPSYNTGAYYVGSTLYAGVQIEKPEGNWKVTPEIGAEIYVFAVGAGLSLSTEAVTPRLGFSILNKGQFHLGYALPFAKNPSFKGFTVSLILNLYND